MSLEESESTNIAGGVNVCIEGGNVPEVFFRCGNAPSVTVTFFKRNRAAYWPTLPMHNMALITRSWRCVGHNVLYFLKSLDMALYGVATANF